MLKHKVYKIFKLSGLIRIKYSEFKYQVKVLLLWKKLEENTKIQ